MNYYKTCPDRQVTAHLFTAKAVIRDGCNLNLIVTDIPEVIDERMPSFYVIFKGCATSHYTYVNVFRVSHYM